MATGTPSQTSAIPCHAIHGEEYHTIDGTVRLSRPRPVSGANYVARTRLADGNTSLDPLRSVQFSSLA